MIFCLTPLSLPLGSIDGKGMDLLFIDIISVPFLLYYVFFTKNKTNFELQITLSIFFMVVTYFLMAIFSSFGGGTIIPILSAVKYVKPFLLIYTGFVLSRMVSLNAFWKASYIAASVIAFSLLISLENGPGRWGDNIFGIEVNGFPNSAAQYYIILFMFIVGFVFQEKRPISFRFFDYFVISIITLFMVFSLSRSAFVLIALFLIALLVQSKVKTKIYFIVVMLISGLVYFNNTTVNSFNFSNGLEARYDRTFNKDDFSSGRLDIAANVLNLLEEKPMLGYKFSSFSNYNEKGHSTPHNQYLESLWKTGIIGSLFYYLIIILLFSKIVKKYIIMNKKKYLVGSRFIVLHKYYYSLFIISFLLLMLGNFTQPNISYSQTGGVLMMLLGYLSQLNLAERK